MKKLLTIQSKLKAPKGQYNNFGKYNYRSCEDIVEAVKPILVEQNCLLTLSDELVNVGERYYIKATATIKDLETNESESVTAFAREEESKKGMDGSQITGASSSYARKYALNGLFAIDDNKDSDSTNTHGNNIKKSNADALKQLEYKLNKYKDAKSLDKDKIELRDAYVNMGIDKKEATDLIMNKLAELQNVSL
jgi:hypothetical protein